jgi:molybdopterin-containing oxidoreductase family iron-sulfur binding subunit
VGDGKHRQWAGGLSGSPGEAYWRSLAELTGAPEFLEAAQGEFPEGADRPGAVSRRGWLKLLGASMALAGCAREHEGKILPYNRNPRDITPGIPRHYATSLTLDGFATGVLVESHEGRPTKIEGNPDHPASLGATGVFEQAAVLGLYDPDRARAPRSPRGPTSFQDILARFAGPRADRGAGLRFLLEPTGSPLLADLTARVGARFPEARFTFHAPARPRNAEEGARIALGAPAQPQHDLGRARVILALDHDFVASGPFAIRYARQFASQRRVSAPTGTMNRLYVVETMLTPTGSMADHRLRRRPSEIARSAAAVAAELVDLGVRPKGMPEALATALGLLRAREDRAFYRALARDLAANAGAAVVMVGDRQPPVVHALAHLVNAALGGDEIAWVIAPTLVGAGAAEQDLPALAREIERGAVETLVIIEGNPVYAAPADLDLARRLPAVANVLYLGAYEDETAHLAGWFVPAAHALESWGDAAAYDGTLSIVQPLIEPLHAGRTPAELLAVFAGVPDPSAHRLVRELWTRRRPGGDFERFWQEALKIGVVAGSASPRLAARLRWDALTEALAHLPPAPAPGALEVSFAPDPAVHDGRFANNAWLEELPRPATKLTWDNAALLSPATAARYGLDTEDVAVLDLRGRRVSAPVLIVPGHADDAVTLHLGYGRKGAESLARDMGFDANVLRTAAAPFFAGGLSMHKVPGATHELARTQLHWNLEGRPIALSSTLAAYRHDPDFTAEQRGRLATLMPPVPMAGNQWAMTIDMSICTGCSACVVACQAENNILVVGKDQVMKGREMHWLRIDTYYSGPAEAPRAVHQPMLCQHCEKAPCEYVCPVNATVHSPDGLNEMVYNRCVGTRFCSNNCPYKVRRFNWFDYNHREEANRGLVQLQRNPDVTVRQRGVMEKCTYCVQRIREAEIHARIERRDIREGEVVTACAAACPTQAIQFGSLHHQGSRMVAWRAEPRRFGVLHELGTAPRTQYLARIDNPNPEIG